ncbi:MAG: hypothetical protein ACT4O6_14235 [Reyranella sp.]
MVFLIMRTARVSLVETAGEIDGRAADRLRAPGAVGLGLLRLEQRPQEAVVVVLHLSDHRTGVEDRLLDADDGAAIDLVAHFLAAKTQGLGPSPGEGGIRRAVNIECGTAQAGAFGGEARGA